MSNELPLENSHDEIDIFRLISIMVKNVKWIFIITLLFMVGVVSYSVVSLLLPPDSSMLPNVYSPKTIVILNNDSENGSSLLAGTGLASLAGLSGLAGGGTSDSDLAIKLAKTNSFIKKLDSEFMLSTIYETKDSKSPKTSLKKLISENLTIAIDEASGLLEISYTDIDKVLATNIVNKATEILEEEFLKIDMIKNKNSFKLAEDNKLKVEKEIERISQETIAFQKKHDLVDVEIVFKELMEQMSDMQTNLLNKEIEIENYRMVSNIEDPGYKRLINERISILNAIEKLENGEVGNFPPVRDLPELALELDKLKSEMEVQTTVYKTIIQQYEALKLTEKGTGPTFQILEKAEIPEIKSGPSRGTLCIKVTFLGFFISIIFIYLREALLFLKNRPDIIRRIKGEQ